MCGCSAPPLSRRAQSPAGARRASVRRHQGAREASSRIADAVRPCELPASIALSAIPLETERTAHDPAAPSPSARHAISTMGFAAGAGGQGVVPALLPSIQQYSDSAAIYAEQGLIGDPVRPDFRPILPLGRPFKRGSDTARVLPGCAMRDFPGCVRRGNCSGHTPCLRRAAMASIALSRESDS
jgi:hypothetical protein